MLTTVVKNSLPLFLVTLLVTSQLSGIKLAKASEQHCCHCDDGDEGMSITLAALAAAGAAYLGGPFIANFLGADEKGVKKGSIASKLQQFSAKSGGLGGRVASTLQRVGTPSGARKFAGETAGRVLDANKRCCPCRSANHEL
ncbi:hypothetical protein ACOMHN_051418 [Nucella lapillus]